MKFNRVEIQAFKSYLDKNEGTFDFTINQGEPADLVSIYAPNGFGKTSFYDAIDFCMTNNITRFIRDSSLANLHDANAKGLNQNGQKQHLLRSKNAPDNLKSEIRIQTTEGEFLSEEIKARTGSKDYTFDEKRTPKDRKYFRDLMLSQEAIDAFLREGKPEDRYKKFMDFQVGGTDSFESDRKVIQMAIKEISKKLTDLQTKILEIEQLNFLNSFDESGLNKTNELISELKKGGLDIPLISNSFSESSKQKLLLQLTEYTQLISDERRLLLNKNNKFDDDLNGLPIFIENVERRKKLSVKISSLKQKSSDVSNYKNAYKEKSLIDKQLTTCKKAISIFKDKLFIYPKFKDASNVTLDTAKRISSNSDSLTKELQLLSVNGSKIDEHEKQKSLYEAAIKSNSDLKRKLPEYFSKIDKINIEKEQLEFESYRFQIKANEDKALLNNKELELIKNLIINNSESVLTCGLDIDNLSLIIKKHSSLLTEIQSLKGQLVAVDEQLNKSNQQSESISALVQLGINIIHKNDSNQCPLCQHDHASFLKLLEKVNSNSYLNDTQKGLLESINQKNEFLEDKNKGISSLSDDFEAAKATLLISNEAKRKKLNFELRGLRSQLEQMNLTNMELTSKLEALNKSTKNLPHIELEQLLDKEAQELSNKIEKIVLMIDKLKCDNLSIENNINITRVDLASLNQVSDNNIKLRIYWDYIEFLQQIAVPPQFIEPELNDDEIKGIISKKLEDEFNKLENLQLDLSNINGIVSELKSKYEDGFFETPDDKEQDISSEISKLNENIVSIDTIYREFINSLERFKLSTYLDDSDWVSLRRLMEKISNDQGISIGVKDKRLQEIQTLSLLVDDVLKYIDNINSLTELEALKQHIVKYKKIKEPLEKDLVQINKSLKDKIDHYFHTELINNIYSKIDPHPDFKKVIFNCEFPEASKPKLNIYIQDYDGGEIISPTLSFSSAQINVLSLSIFLAKAINTKDSFGNPVNCIFIDDPVQSLDSINVLGIIDLFRSICITLGKQIIISTHDDNFHSLLQQKLPTNLFKSKYLSLESFGKVSPHF
ncbi:MAG: exonuclease SbcC [Colwellia sp.]|jgi:exonuclease SbcC